MDAKPDTQSQKTRSAAKKRLCFATFGVSKAFWVFVPGLRPLTDHRIVMMMKSELEAAIAQVCKDLFDVDARPNLTRPDEQFGDYATNIVLQLAGRLNKKPRELAEQLAPELQKKLSDHVSEVSIAGPGFINLRLSDARLLAAMGYRASSTLKSEEIVLEFGDPNPFKEMHLGHLYTAIVGDTIARLFEAKGAQVHRVSYHGDVGLHVAKAVWGMRTWQTKENRDVTSIRSEERASFLSTIYAYGASEYEKSQASKDEIQEVNEHIYRADDPEINKLYRLGKEWSFTYFDEIFDELGIHFERRYLESESSQEGLKFVQDSVGRVFEKSDGAVIYRGEKAGLHTRVFVNSRGLPTYEAKDLGLAELKKRDYPTADRSIIITAHEQSEYFKVMLAALREIDAELADKTTHLSHGFLSLTTGKMSSRTGRVYSALSLMRKVEEIAKQAYPDSGMQDEVYKAALKYTFLKNRIGGDIVFDVKESVSLQGNSGPYLQYAHARARSVLAKATLKQQSSNDLEKGERTLARKITEYPEVVQLAINELMPHHIATYLYELAQTFNTFYEHNRVIDDPREAIRLQLVKQYANTLKDGLELLGIHAPDRM